MLSSVRRSKTMTAVWYHLGTKTATTQLVKLERKWTRVMLPSKNILSLWNLLKNWELVCSLKLNKKHEEKRHFIASPRTSYPAPSNTPTGGQGSTELLRATVTCRYDEREKCANLVPLNTSKASTTAWRNAWEKQGGQPKAIYNSAVSSERVYPIKKDSIDKAKSSLITIII